MAHLDPSSAEVLVFTFKEGLLSAVAHDLKLRVTKFGVDVDGGQVTAEFDPTSLRVVNAMKDGKDDPGALPGFAFGEIEKNIVNDVLEAKRHPAIRFETTSITDAQVTGRLTLHGQTKSLTGTRKDEGGRKVAEFRFDQRDFGIKPFSAMLGALKIKPEIVVRVSLSA
ncbi:MAG: YceI family protein [Myxococcota bacterium]|jgi:polyisoprenoid-binding protein YceI